MTSKPMINANSGHPNCCMVYKLGVECGLWERGKGHKEQGVKCGQYVVVIRCMACSVSSVGEVCFKV